MKKNYLLPLFAMLCFTGKSYAQVLPCGTTVQIIVSDITGKVVYSVSKQVTGNELQVQIPHEAISVQGMYLVQTITGNQTHTQKLVVE